MRRGRSRDANALVEYLEDHGSISPNHKIGTMGYCTGGPIVMCTAAARPDRIGAVASFHGGGLVTDAAGISAEVEIYQGAQHGWCVPDSPVYNDDQAERAWSRLPELFARAL